ncbi:MAG: hypothetical protein WBG30_08875 [Psychrilyobacter sp.]|uniref:hypothetical protein n=1 Tax=Psychrilyobacter sp. TaxID=2586924 RepID=UPI003C752361
MNLLKEAKKFCKKNRWRARCRIVGNEIVVIFPDLPFTTPGNTEKSAERFKKLFSHLSEVRNLKSQSETV